MPWWPDAHSRTNLFAVMVHVLGETVRHAGHAGHAGHADILRGTIDGRTGLRAEHEQQIDEEARAAHCAKIERAARTAAAPIKAQEVISIGRADLAGGGRTASRPGSGA